MQQTRSFHSLNWGSLSLILAMAPASAANTHGDLQQLTIEPDDVHEACLQLAPPQQLHYAFTATGELAFNIHYHADHQVVYPVKEHSTLQADANFTPESGQHYCLMWTNQGSSVVELSLQQEIHGTTD